VNDPAKVAVVKVEEGDQSQTTPSSFQERTTSSAPWTLERKRTADIAVETIVRRRTVPTVHMDSLRATTATQGLTWETWHSESVAQRIRALTNEAPFICDQSCGCMLSVSEPTINLASLGVYAEADRKSMDALGMLLAEQVARNETDLIVNVLSVLMDLEAPVYSIWRIGFRGMGNLTDRPSAGLEYQMRNLESFLTRATNDVTESFRFLKDGRVVEMLPLADNPSSTQRKLAQFAIGSAEDLGVLRFIKDLLQIAVSDSCPLLRGGLLNGHTVIQTRRGVAYKPSGLPSFQYSDESWSSMQVRFRENFDTFDLLSRHMAGRDVSEEFRFLIILMAPRPNVCGLFEFVNKPLAGSGRQLRIESIYPDREEFLREELFALCAPAPITVPVLQEYEEKLATWAVQDFERFQYFYLLAKTAQVPLVLRQIVFRKSCAILATLLTV
jgi:hypothetical protein